jgi:hypothetical protein
MDPSPISFTLLLLFTFTRTVYFLAYYYCFPLDTLNPLFTVNRWDWQPYHNLEEKFLVVLCAGSTLLLVQSKALDEVSYKLSGAVAKLAGITFWTWLFSTGSVNLGFLLREYLLLCSSHLLLGFPTGQSSTSTPQQQSPVAGEIRPSDGGSWSTWCCSALRALTGGLGIDWNDSYPLLC